MKLEYPYQLVAFLEAEPPLGEAVYGGKDGWYPQIALKRRFKTVGIDERELFARIEAFCKQTSPLAVKSGLLIKPDKIPVKVLGVDYTNQIRDFHLGFIAMLGNNMESRYPERDGDNYYPHITAEYGGKMVIDADQYADRQYLLGRVCLLKDTESEDSEAYRFFELK